MGYWPLPVQHSLQTSIENKSFVNRHLFVVLFSFEFEGIQSLLKVPNFRNVEGVCVGILGVYLRSVAKCRQSSAGRWNRHKLSCCRFAHIRLALGVVISVTNIVLNSLLKSAIKTINKNKLLTVSCRARLS
jgi:hypothetical protein